MNYVVVHSYALPDFNRIGKHKPEPDETCENCMFSEKTRLIDEEEGLLCKARLYDVKTLSCFVPDYEKMRTNENKDDDRKEFSGLLTEGDD